MPEKEYCHSYAGTVYHVRGGCLSQDRIHDMRDGVGNKDRLCAECALNWFREVHEGIRTILQRHGTYQNMTADLAIRLSQKTRLLRAITHRTQPSLVPEV